MLLESAFHWLFCLKFSFKLVTFSKSYARKQKWAFFGTQRIHTIGLILLYINNKDHILDYLKK